MGDLREAKFSHLYSEVFPPPKSSSASKDDILKVLARDSVEFGGHKDEVLRKLEGKPLLLSNPESKRSSRKAKKPVKSLSNVLKQSERRSQDKKAIVGLKYEQMLPLHRLWEGYMKDLVSCTQYKWLSVSMLSSILIILPSYSRRRANLENALLRADYHGAHLRVIQSKCPSFVGKAGLVIQETMQTFILLEPSSRHIVIPKAGSVLACEIALPTSLDCPAKDILRWQLFGDQLRQHSGLRSSKKFKSKFSVTL